MKIRTIRDIRKPMDSLRNSDKSFMSIYSVMKRCFDDEVFCEKVVNGRMTKTTYSQLFDRTERLACALKKTVQAPEGSYVSLKMENSELWVESFWACLMAGYNVLLVNVRFDERTIEEAENDVGSAFAVSDSGEGINAAELLEQCQEKMTDGEWGKNIALMSSGTSGKPKIIVYDGESIAAQVLISEKIVHDCPSIKTNRTLQVKHVAMLPFYHIFGLVAVLLWFSFFGRSFVFLDSMDSQSIQFACKRYNASHFFAIPLVWDTVANSIYREAERQGQTGKLEKGIKLSLALQGICPRLGRWIARNMLFKDVRRQALGNSVVFCISGGGFVKERTQRLMTAIGYTLHNGYGLTESGIVSVELSMRPGRLISPGVGKLFDCVKYEIRNGGELYLQSDCSYCGYFSDGVFVERNRGEFYDTGDLAEIDKTGRLNLFCRADDMIIGSSGENMNPDITEKRIFCPYPFTIVGTGPRDAQVPVGIVEFPVSMGEYARASAANSLFDEIEKLPVGMRPSAVYSADEPIPLNLGKIKRAELRSRIGKGEFRMTKLSRTASEKMNEVYDADMVETIKAVKAVMGETLGIEPGTIGDDAHFIYDLGGTSLSYYDFLSRLKETTGAEPGSGNQTGFTPAQIARAIVGGGVN